MKCARTFLLTAGFLIAADTTVQARTSHGYSGVLTIDTVTSVNDDTGALPQVVTIEAIYPNPFNPRTSIKYDLPEAGPVRLSVFDLAGRLVRTLVDEGMPSGSHDVVWDGRDSSGKEVSSGTYLARLEFNGRVETVRTVLVK